MSMKKLSVILLTTLLLFPFVVNALPENPYDFGKHDWLALQYKEYKIDYYYYNDSYCWGDCGAWYIRFYDEKGKKWIVTAFETPKWRSIEGDGTWQFEETMQWVEVKRLSEEKSKDFDGPTLIIEEAEYSYFWERKVCMESDSGQVCGYIKEYYGYPILMKLHLILVIPK